MLEAQSFAKQVKGELCLEVGGFEYGMPGNVGHQVRNLKTRAGVRLLKAEPVFEDQIDVESLSLELTAGRPPAFSLKLSNERVGRLLALPQIHDI